jgi:methyl-accepting chemotaxis protein
MEETLEVASNDEIGKLAGAFNKMTQVIVKNLRSEIDRGGRLVHSVKEAIQRIGRLLRRSGDRAARLYEVVVQETPDVARARRRGRSDAYQAATRLSLGQASQLDLF